MASPSRIAANRKNAAKSTGPKTPSGKAASARNAVRHGLSSATICVLPTENRSDLDALSKALTDEHKPQGDTETFLIHQMISARWKLARIERLEAEAFDGVETDGDVLDTLSQSGNILDKLQRHSAAAERSYFKALRELQKLRSLAEKTKLQNEASDAEEMLRDLLASTPLGAGDLWIDSGEASVQNEPNLPAKPVRFSTLNPPGALLASTPLGASDLWIDSGEASVQNEPNLPAKLVRFSTLNPPGA